MKYCEGAIYEFKEVDDEIFTAVFEEVIYSFVTCDAFRVSFT